jgi:hypothetical protein
MDFEQIMQQMKAQYEENLKEMVLPPGVEDHLRKMVSQGDSETVVFMLKLAWVFGAQAGQAAATQALQADSQPTKRRIEA